MYLRTCALLASEKKEKKTLVTYIWLAAAWTRCGYNYKMGKHYEKRRLAGQMDTHIREFIGDLIRYLSFFFRPIIGLLLRLGSYLFAFGPMGHSLDSEKLLRARYGILRNGLLVHL